MSDNSEQQLAAAEYDRSAIDYALATERPLASIRFATIANALDTVRKDLPTQSKIVDLGCGTGKSTELIRRMFPSAVISGVDVSEIEIQHARDRAIDEKLDIEYAVSDLYSVHFSANSVDMYVAVMALHYFQYQGQLSRLLARLYIQLQPQGVLLFQIPNPELPLPYRDFGVKHQPSLTETLNQPEGSIYPEGSPYKVALYSQPHRRFEPDWGQPLVEFTNYRHYPQTYQAAFETCRFSLTKMPLIIPESLYQGYADVDWSEFQRQPLYVTYVACKQ